MSSDTFHNLKLACLFACVCGFFFGHLCPLKCKHKESRRLASRSQPYPRHSSPGTQDGPNKPKMGEGMNTDRWEDFRSELSWNLAVRKDPRPMILKVRIPSLKQNASSDLIIFWALYTFRKDYEGLLLSQTGLYIPGRERGTDLSE